MMLTIFQFVTSLTFLYTFVITLLIVYGIVYYKSFARNRTQRKRFPWVFLLIGSACFGFLYLHMHPPLSLKTFSNTDHYFIRHDGFRVAGQVELGRTDTAHFRQNAYNSFVLRRSKEEISISSSYSEEPLYLGVQDRYKLLSVHYPATGHPLSFTSDTVQVSIKAISDTNFELGIGKTGFRVHKQVKKGISVWNLFRDAPDFINSSWYTQENINRALRQLFLLRDDVGKEETGQLVYFISGELIQPGVQVKYDGNNIDRNSLVFSKRVPAPSSIAWGIGFWDNNRNQFLMKLQGRDSFELANKFPVSYPLTAEDRGNFTPHSINKFLVSDPKNLAAMPVVFNEGFLFTSFEGDSLNAFAPVLLSYKNERAGAPLALRATNMNDINRELPLMDNKLLLPAGFPGVNWVFSVQDSFNWKLGGKVFSSSAWQWLIFGSLGIFFLLIFGSSWLQPAYKLSWIWQLLSCVTLVLLTTRFFLYWRYKSFPPYEGLDLPSLQQLNSFWNFGIILFATLVLGVVLGFHLLSSVYRYSVKKLASVLQRPYQEGSTGLLPVQQWSNKIVNMHLLKKRKPLFLFFTAWSLLLTGAGGFAALNDFDPATCRHLAIGLVLSYFLFLFISYRYSPLVAAAEKSWWALSTASWANILISNPVKVLLSVSLLALFALVDIGFAIVFLNFLFFNEAFLCINYSMAGLSAGSKRNAALFAGTGFVYIILFAVNLTYGPYIFKYLLDLPQLLYTAGYVIFSISIAYTVSRLLSRWERRKKMLVAAGMATGLFTMAFLFFPKERILEKAAMTKYRIDVMAMPVDKAIEEAYDDGKTYTPVIRAAQNQWFINTFIYEKNNPGVNSAAFHLLPHAPQNKGAKYNAQATDLVASRFMIAEHGKWSVLLYVLLLMLPAVLLASFYKLYPDFTNRINNQYPSIIAGFSLLNYLLITALLVILAATGRYIFFGQDLPFGSILSKQSVLFPSIIVILLVLLFKKISLEQYPNRKKMVPGGIVFTGLVLLLFLFKPAFNKNKEFTVNEVAKNMDMYIQLRLQPILDHIDASPATRKMGLAQKDKLFADSLRQLLASGYLDDAGKFFLKEISAYTKGSFSRHLDDSRLLYLDLNSGKPQLAVNDNYFRVEPPPHLQQYWTGNVFGDTTDYNITSWNAANGSLTSYRTGNYAGQQRFGIDKDLAFVLKKRFNEDLLGEPALVNTSSAELPLILNGNKVNLKPGDTIAVSNPSRVIVLSTDNGKDRIITVQPDAFMKNYYVNGSRFYVYPMADRFIWARHFAEGISSDYTAKGMYKKDAYVSLNVGLMDSLSARISRMMAMDTSYHIGAEYGICIADGNGRLIAMSDFINGMIRPDPNDKAGFNTVIRGENGIVSQSLLRKQVGNINLLRLNPGPGSTLKPVVFSAIASQLNLDWDAFAAEGFSVKQQYYGGEKVAEYDFEKNNGRITTVKDYLKYSDNYYHSNLLLLGSYSRQSLQDILANHFATSNPEQNLHWPYFSYKGRQYWLNGFENWPGYTNGKADFGSDSSFVSTGLFNNYGIFTYRSSGNAGRFNSGYDSTLFMGAARRSGFIMPEYALFDQKGSNIDHRIPYDVFMSSFKGHVKGSSQVMIPPVKMTEAYGRLISQNKNYSLTLNPYATVQPFQAFDVNNGVIYSQYLSLMRESVFTGMKEALYTGTAAKLGSLLKDAGPYFYYAKTGTTGDDASEQKSKLFAIIISERDVTDPDYNFRNNRFFTIYFTSQDGPARQNEQFQAEIIRYVQQSAVFKEYMRKEERSR